MSEPDLDDSMAVEAIAWGMYLGWMSVVAYIALYLGIEPLPTIADRFSGWTGTLAAVAAGVVFIGVSGRVFKIIRGRSDDAETPEESAPEPSASPSEPAKRKRRKKKKRRSR